MTSSSKEQKSVRLYTFWEGSKPPLYLELCMETWHANIPNLQIEQINYSNIGSYVAPYVDINKLKKFSLAMQSDVISAVVLATRGGTFIDIDTIMLPNVNIDFLKSRNDKVNVFGMPQNGKFHVAIMSSLAKNPVMVRWMNEASKRVDLSPREYSWNYLAGDILEKMSSDNAYSHYFNIIDRRTSGNILEASWGQTYNQFYFGESSQIKIEDLLKKSEYGIISLHNSWTPQEYSQVEDRDELLMMNKNISRILRYALGREPESK